VAALVPAATPTEEKMTLGSASYAFMSSPARLSTIEFLAVAFLIVVIAIHWGRFINDVS